MRIAFALGGTDWGRSGVGVYTRAVLEKLVPALAKRGGALIALGTAMELDVYGDALAGVERRIAPTDRPGPSAAWYAARAGAVAKAAGADVFLLPAANRRIAFASSLPVVGVVHDLAQLHVTDKYDRLRMFYFRHVLLRALGTMTRLVAVSAATKTDVLSALGTRCPPTDVVPNGVDSARFRPLAREDDSVVRVLRELRLDKPYILYSARLEHPGKNHLRLLEAFASSRARRTHRLLLAGKDWGAAERIDAESKRLGLGDSVRRLGFVDDAVLPPLVAAADAIAMVGLHEGFGLPALEGLAAGRPVFASSTGALPEVVGELGVLADPNDVDSLRIAMERTLYDSALRERVASEGPAWARARDWARTADGLLAACELTLDKHRV